VKIIIFLKVKKYYKYTHNEDDMEPASDEEVEAFFEDFHQSALNFKNQIDRST